MSDAIRASLNKLHNSIQKLEGAVEAKKNAPPAQKKGNGQPDLFAAPAAPGFNPVNVRMLATRLDKAIDQVENILKEARR